MDWMTLRGKGAQLFGKYKYVCFVLVLGMILMCLPESAGGKVEDDKPETTAAVPGMASQLEEILTQIDGVGKVQVLLTEAAGEEMIFQTDEDSAFSEESKSLRMETVIVQDADRRENGLVRQVNPPRYRGAVVVCQGADRAEVQLAIVEAVSAVTDISADRISVLKMK